MASLWACACGALNRSTDEQCEACGKPSATGKPVAQRHFAQAMTAPKVQETHAPARLPEHREPTPEEDREIRATLAALKTAPWWRDTHGTARLPPVDPEVRATVERPLGAIVDDTIRELKGAPR